MRNKRWVRFLTVLAAAGAIVWAARVSTLASENASPRTSSNGEPNLQGTWVGKLSGKSFDQVTTGNKPSSVKGVLTVAITQSAETITALSFTATNDTGTVFTFPTLEDGSVGNFRFNFAGDDGFLRCVATGKVNSKATKISGTLRGGTSTQSFELKFSATKLVP